MLFKEFFFKNEILTEGYSAVVLDDNSYKKLINDPQIIKYINPEHQIVAHHMTIKMGGLGGSIHVSRLGNIETLNATHVGITNDRNVVAVKVDGASENEIPHITISINRKKNAKPKDSNKITKWLPLRYPIRLSGTVKELN